jgi:hypothetical protein
MLINQWALVLTQSFQDLSYGLIQFIPRLLIAIIIFIIGWLVGAGLKRLVMQVVSALKIDEALTAAGVEKVIHRAGWKMNSGAFLGTLVKWFVIVVFLLASLEVLQLTTVTLFLQAVVLTSSRYRCCAHSLGSSCDCRRSAARSCWFSCSSEPRFGKSPWFNSSLGYLDLRRPCGS